VHQKLHCSPPSVSGPNVRWLLAEPPTVHWARHALHMTSCLHDQAQEAYFLLACMLLAASERDKASGLPAHVMSLKRAGMYAASATMLFWLITVVHHRTFTHTHSGFACPKTCVLSATCCPTRFGALPAEPCCHLHLLSLCKVHWRT
jgi:hypothetical protein